MSPNAEAVLLTNVVRTLKQPKGCGPGAVSECARSVSATDRAVVLAKADLLSLGQAAVRFPMRSGDEVSLSFTTPEELPR